MGPTTRDTADTRVATTPHSASRRAESPPLLTTTTGRPPRRTTMPLDNDVRRRSRYFVQKFTRLLIKDGAPSKGVLGYDSIAFPHELVLSRVMFLCRPIDAQVGLESARSYISSSASPAIIHRSNFPLRSPLWNILSRTHTH